MQGAHFSTAQMLNIAAISPTMLNKWIELDVIEASIRPADGTGSDRIFSFGDLVAAAVVSKLRTASVPLSSAAPIARYVATSMLNRAPGEFAVVFPGGEFITTSGKNLAQVIREHASKVGTVILLDDIYKEAHLNAIESRLMPKPHRGRKPGQKVGTAAVGKKRSGYDEKKWPTGAKAKK